jgi:hypothetical protein
MSIAVRFRLSRPAWLLLTPNHLFPGGSSAGATGLEPATSGVTDEFEDRHVNDDGCDTHLFKRPFDTAVAAHAWPSKQCREVCCPSAACE